MAKVKRIPGIRAQVLGAAIALSLKDGKVGWFESATYEGGQPVAGVAYVMEHGSATGIPPRPYFRPTADEQQGAWAQTSAQISRAILRGQMAPGSLMEALCLKAEGDVRAAITKVTSPPLAEATIAARKRKLAKGTLIKAGKTMGIEKPLVASGLMLASLTSKVE